MSNSIARTVVAPASSEQEARRPNRRRAGRSDSDLAAAAATGDRDAFERIFARHSGRLLSYCRHTLTNPHDAEDALQQTFISAYRSLRASGPPQELAPWLYAIARNCCRDIYARRGATVELPPELPLEGLSDHVHQRQDLRDLLRDLAGLPEEQRTALLLSELEGLPHRAIATIIGCPEPKVRALVYQARSTLLAERDARETACDEIREQLAVARGAALRRGRLKRHLRGCPGCRAFATGVREQRSALALALPVLPLSDLLRHVVAEAATSGPVHTTLTAQAVSGSGAGTIAPAATGSASVATSAGGAASVAKIAAILGATAAVAAGAGALAGSSPRSARAAATPPPETTHPGSTADRPAAATTTSIAAATPTATTTTSATRAANATTSAATTTPAATTTTSATTTTTSATTTTPSSAHSGGASVTTTTTTAIAGGTTTSTAHPSKLGQTAPAPPAGTGTVAVSQAATAVHLDKSHPVVRHVTRVVRRRVTVRALIHRATTEVPQPAETVTTAVTTVTTPVTTATMATRPTSITRRRSGRRLTRR